MVRIVFKKSKKIPIKIDPELKEIIPTFIKNRHKDLDLLKELYQKRDYNQIQIMGHNLAGLGRTYGFEQITDIGLRLQESAKAFNEKQTKEVVDEFSKYLEDIEIV